MGVFSLVPLRQGADGRLEVVRSTASLATWQRHDPERVADELGICENVRVKLTVETL
jgi:hypothetical protein